MSARLNANTENEETMGFNIEKIRSDFPVLSRQVNGNPLVYLDNGATSQKPLAVIETLDKYYREYNSNIHRGVHTLSEEATTEYEAARKKIKSFINANSTQEIILTSGTTDAINLVAQSYGRTNIKADDEIIITEMEHHSNIVPWQLLCEQTGAKLKVVPINDAGEIIIEEFEQFLNEKTKLVGIVHISNALGTINPVKEIIDLAHAKNVPVLIDGAQAVPHCKVDVQELDCDFYCFSGHKLFGPTGTGVLYGKQSLLEAMPPWKGGGDMIRTVRFDKSTYNDLPYKFEAGTPHIAGVIGLGAAIDYVSSISMDAISAYEADLLDYATKALSSIDDLRLIGTAKHKASILSFVMEKIHPHDLGTILDQHGIAIRTGHHCAMPVMERYKIPATARASLALYNTKQEIDILVDGLNNVKKVFA
ncbi:MAG: cysteine desulfurase/selenocysteine lyase [Gammaproteobacteria bacterium]|jgi:cysteine desulfurase/selenocysteine lyase